MFSVQQIYIFHFSAKNKRFLYVLLNFIWYYSWICEIYRMAITFSIFNLTSEKYYIVASYFACEISFYSITTIGSVNCNHTSLVETYLISFWIRFSFLIIVPKYLNCTTFSKHVTNLYVMILPCILVKGEQHVLSFLYVYL